MKKIAYAIIFSIIAVTIDLSLINFWGARYFLCGLVPLVFFLAILRPFDEAIVFSAVCGLVFDIVSGGDFFFMTAFLLFEALLIFQVKRRLISFANPFIIFVSLAFLGLTKALASLAIFWWRSFSAIDLVIIILANCIFAFSISVIFFIIQKLYERRKHIV